MTTTAQNAERDTSKKSQRKLAHKLSDSLVERLVCLPGETHTDYSDTSRAFFARVFKNGEKFWYARWRGRGDDKKLRIVDPLIPGSNGRWGTKEPDTTTARARALAHAYRVELDAGRDPHVSLKPATLLTLGQVFDSYYAEVEKDCRGRPGTIMPPEDEEFQQTRGIRSILRLIHPEFADALMIGLNGRDGAARITKFLEDNDYRNRPGSARSVCLYTSAAIALAIRRNDPPLPKGYENPAYKLAESIKWIKNRARGSHAINIEAPDLTRLFNTLHMWRGARPQNGPESKGVQPIVAMMFEMLLLCGARPNEIKTLTMDHFVDGKKVKGEIQKDERTGVWTITKEWHKTRLRTGAPRYIVFGGPDVDNLWAAILAERIRMGKEDSPWVFPTSGVKGARSGHLMDVSVTANKLFDYADMPEEMVAYGLRSAYINYALDSLGTDIRAVEIVSSNVGHANVMTTFKFYRVKDTNKMHDFALALGEKFAELTAAPVPPDDDDLIEIADAAE